HVEVRALVPHPAAAAGDADVGADVVVEPAAGLPLRHIEIEETGLVPEPLVAGHGMEVVVDLGQQILQAFHRASPPAASPTGEQCTIPSVTGAACQPWGGLAAVRRRAYAHHKAQSYI